MSDPLDTDAGRAVVDAAVEAVGAKRAARPDDAWDLRSEVVTALLAALAVRTREPCPDCMLHGYADNCPTCDGSGTVPGVPALVELLMEPLDDHDFFSEYQLELLNGKSAYIVRPLPGAAE